MLLSTNGSERELPGGPKDFSKVEALNGWDGINTRSGLHEIQAGRDYKCLDEVFPFVPAYIDRSTE